jgi:hypothetical protein
LGPRLPRHWRRAEVTSSCGQATQWDSNDLVSYKHVYMYMYLVT